MNGFRAPLLCTAAILAALIVPGSASAAGYDFPLSGYWPMNEGKGQLVRDWSGNGNNGQLGSTAGVDANDPSWIRGIYGWSYGLHFSGNQFVPGHDFDFEWRQHSAAHDDWSQSRSRTGVDDRGLWRRSYPTGASGSVCRRGGPRSPTDTPATRARTG